MNKKGFVASILFIVVFLLFFFIKKENVPYEQDQGLIFGTIYHITYQYDKNLKTEIEEELRNFDLSLSPFNKNSTISRINRNDSTVIPDKWLLTVFNRSQEIYKATGGAFDPTLSPLINAWGFGFSKVDSVTPALIDSLRQFVGLNKINLNNGRIIKQDNRMSLNFSAIAKGYACDVIASLLAEKGIKNYLVEIGGEISAKGMNSQNKKWQIGINKPIENLGANAEEFECVVQLSNGGMATSGNYRNFYYKDKKRYTHTIDPTTGYPVEHTLLSATVIAPDCMTADAYATAFMVLGLEKSIVIAQQNKEIEAYFIYSDKNDSTAVIMTPGMKKYLVGTP